MRVKVLTQTIAILFFSVSCSLLSTPKEKKPTVAHKEIPTQIFTSTKKSTEQKPEAYIHREPSTEPPDLSVLSAQLESISARLESIERPPTQFPEVLSGFEQFSRFWFLFVNIFWFAIGTTFGIFVERLITSRKNELPRKAFRPINQPINA